MPADRNRVPIALDISKSEAMDFAELVKRLSRRNLGPSDLNLATAASKEITLGGWRHRGLGERLNELRARMVEFML